MSNSRPYDAVSERIDAFFAQNGIAFTLGGEPTLVPLEHSTPEWTVTALGPTKLRYAYALAGELRSGFLAAAVEFYCPGKSYPGEVNPRWVVTLVWNKDGSPLVPALAESHPPVGAKSQTTARFCRLLLKRLGLEGGWIAGNDPFNEDAQVSVLPLDYRDGLFVSEDWDLGKEIELLRTDGPAGLRLPLHMLGPDVSGRALTVELRDDRFDIFLPPLMQGPFLALLDACASTARETNIGPIRFAATLPGDEGKIWVKLGIAADPGVLEINLPPCKSWTEYRWWLDTLEASAGRVGLRSFKQTDSGEELGTGGGNHLLFGGETLDDHPFFSRPRWVTSILRYWQHHPSLAYLFTGQYVGASSQAPRPDECAASLYDLEVAYGFLEQLPPGDHRYLISETLRHLHTDASGNTHRSEASFDKFWNVNFDGGCRGLIEFRAIESLPKASWMSAIALLWQSLAAWLLDKPFTKPLLDHGKAIHDRFFLPSGLWADFETVLTDLENAGYALPREAFKDIFTWRFPIMLTTDSGLIVRKALEGWPLLCETPLEGGSTSRFVDTSIERLELSVPSGFDQLIAVQGRKIDLHPLPSGQMGAGLRYRRTALYPCLHPGIPIQLPLYLSVSGDTKLYRLEEHRRTFVAADSTELPSPGTPARKLDPDLLTYDLRL